MSTYVRPALKLFLVDWSDTAFSSDRTRIDRDKKHCICFRLCRWENGEWTLAQDLRMDLVASLVKESNHDLPKNGTDGQPLLQGECNVTAINGEAKFEGLMFRCLKAHFHCNVRLKVVAADERLRSEHEGLTYVHPDAYLVETCVRKREKKREKQKAAKGAVVGTPARPASAATSPASPAPMMPHAGEAFSIEEDLHECEQLEERIAEVNSRLTGQQLVQEEFRLQRLQTRVMLRTIAKQQETINNLRSENLTVMTELREIRRASDSQPNATRALLPPHALLPPAARPAHLDQLIQDQAAVQDQAVVDRFADDTLGNPVAAQPTAEFLANLSSAPQPTSFSTQSTDDRERTASETAPTASPGYGGELSNVAEHEPFLTAAEQEQLLNAAEHDQFFKTLVAALEEEAH